MGGVLFLEMYTLKCTPPIPGINNPVERPNYLYKKYVLIIMIRFLKIILMACFLFYVFLLHVQIIHQINIIETTCIRIQQYSD